MNDPTEETREERDLKAIPRKYLHPTINTHYVPVRTEAYTTLKDIKKHHEMTHPFITQEELEIDYKNTAVGIDGVLEANHGSRTLIVVSVMFGGCIYIWKIYNPYKNCVGAKPTACELLWYVRLEEGGINDQVTTSSSRRPLIDEINADSQVSMRHLVADMLERHNCRC